MEDIYCFAGNPLDRVSERRRDREWIAALLADPTSRILPLYDLKPAVRDMEAPVLEWQSLAAWREPIAAGATCIFLGIAEGGIAHFALDATGAASGSNAIAENVDVRTLAPLVPSGEAAILAEARSLIDWHARHGFCAQCGTRTNVSSAGWTRRCPNCRASHYPRSDPVTIMLVVRGERALLGRNKRRPGRRFSCLAGFMEPGMKLSVEFVDGRAVNVLFPDILELKIADTAPPVHQQQDSTLKAARLENGVEIMVPQFVKTGDVIRLDPQTMKYVERVKADAKARHA